MRPRRSHSTTAITLLAIVLSATTPVLAEEDDAPRTPGGRPDLTGTYDIATLTPLQRPAQFGENLYLTKEEALAIEAEEREFLAKGAEQSDPDRDAPAEGGAPPVGLDDSQRELLGAGNVGGYNNFWIDRGDSVVEVDGKFRTSIITEPANGRWPSFSPAAMKSFAALRDLFRPNDGRAYWLEWDRPGPYDDPEQRPLAERCLASFASTVPALPALYNNFKRIVLTEDSVLILNEMVHDARVVRMNSEHAPPEMKFWLGDSIGWWEGDTLVVDSTNFRSQRVAMAGPTETLHVVERFTRKDKGTLHYEFTVEDPSLWTAPWKGDFTWPATPDRVFEYACHEGNYALGNIMRGARKLEAEASQ